MKTTVELPEATFRRARVMAATRRMTVELFVTEAVQEYLRRFACKTHDRDKEPPWMAGFGVLADLSNENRRVLRMIEEEFEGTGSLDSA